ncbi:MAG: mechanosensitive ion channel [Candidatus Altiarchaeales archaeon]|nr:mechanosensitive ion channel [Candidatus Altiarchaeales archaeon]
MNAGVDLSFLGIHVAGNTVQQYLVALAVFAVARFLIGFFKSVVLHRLKDLTGKTQSDLDDILIEVIEGISPRFWDFLAFYAALQFIAIPGFIQKVVDVAAITVAIFYSVRVVQSIIEYGKREVIKERKEKDETEDVSMIQTLSDILKYSVWVFALILLLDNMGYDITTLVAGIGVGGVAIALASQALLADLFASFAIYFDKPFKVGDFILIDNDLGAVDQIGIKTTRLKTLRGEELVVSNQEMTSIRIHNFGKMPHRRIDFSFGVTYQTPSEKLKKIPQMVKKIVEEQDLTRFDRAHFKKFGASSLDYEVVYYLDSPDYNKYMDTQQAINLGLVEAFEKEEIEFAYPTQTIYVE